MMKKTLFILIFVFVVCVPTFAQTNGKAALIVKFRPVEQSDGELQRVVRYDFDNGKLISTKILFTANVEIDGSVSGIKENRYLPTRLFKRTGSGEGFDKNFDLVTEKFDKAVPVPVRTLYAPKPYLFKSPDGEKGVVLSGLQTIYERLVIQIKGREDIIVEEKFVSTVSESSSSRLPLPVIWLDNETILTQKNNGSLVTVSTGGKVEPFLELPCGKDDSVGFRKTPAGKFIYACSGREYRLDVVNRKFERARRDLDHDFSQETVDKVEEFFYRDKLIGRGGINAMTVENYLATLQPPSGKQFVYAEDIKTIRVWNAFNRRWKTLNVDGDNATILGWFVP